jgi:para-nitrobenzyl esterase
LEEGMTVVTTTAGRIRGAAGIAGLVFKGIPFAAPPVGPRRFAAPERSEPWEGVRDCTAFGPICPQLPMVEAGGVLPLVDHPEASDEDCLFLNVWTPAADDAARPVIVWIHGGAFVEGSGSKPMYEGTSFARDGIVFVSLNYRLNALGFLYLDEDFDSACGTGNLGLLDQLAALRWVQENIAGFGGDPLNVTVAGQSAGAHCIGALLAAPRAEGLFRRAILQSGAGHLALPRSTARTVSHRVLDLVGVQPGDWGALLGVPAQALVRAAMQVMHGESDALLGGVPFGTLLPFAPAVDGQVLHDRPDRWIADHGRGEVDVLVGTCEDEFRLFWFGMPAAVSASLPAIEIASYFPGDTPTGYRGRDATADELDASLAVASDAVFGIPAIRLAEAQLRCGSRTWMYRFSWRTPIRGGALRACHALDLPFVFAELASKETVGEQPPENLAHAMHGAWVSFAATGRPAHCLLPPWPQYDLQRRPVMVFGERATGVVVHDPRGLERRLWDGIR